MSASPQDDHDDIFDDESAADGAVMGAEGDANGAGEGNLEEAQGDAQSGVDAEEQGDLMDDLVRITAR